MLLAVIIILWIISRIPIKRVINMENINEEENFLICEFIATTGPDWKVHTVNLGESELVYLEGNLPNNKLNKPAFFFFARNKFLIRAEVIGEVVISAEGDIRKYYDDSSIERMKVDEQNSSTYKILKVFEWDIIAPIERGDVFRFMAPKKYLNIYDFIF